MKLDDVQKASINNFDELDKVDVCGCYHCINTFDVEEVTEFVDNGTTALCPHCGVDSIIPGTVNKFFLEKAYQKYFG